MVRGFKRFPHDWRKRVFKELKGIRLSVWMYHWSRSGPDDTVQTTLDQLVADLPYCKSRIVKARGELRKAGWLGVDRESYRDERGHWTVPTFKPVIPDTVSAFPVTAKGATDSDLETDSAEGPNGTVARKAATAKGATTVDTRIPVDTGGSDPSGLRVNTTLSLPPSSLSAILENPEKTEKPEVGGYAVETLQLLNQKLFGDLPVQDRFEPIMSKLFSNGTRPTELREKILGFADWMLEYHPLNKEGSPRLASLKDFFHHWNNESGSDTGFRLQWEALRKIKEKDAPVEDFADIPRSEWDWICRAPACSRPWTEEVYEIKLCARCAAAFPDHPAERAVKWAGEEERQEILEGLQQDLRENMIPEEDVEDVDFGDNEEAEVKYIQVEEL